MRGSVAVDPKQRCPRCGYDLRGLVASWTDRCPRRESCTECGYEVDWSEQFDEHRLPGWYVESAKRLPGVVTRTPGTFLRMLPPGFAWSRIGLTALSRVSLRGGLVVWLAALVLACYLACGLLVVTPLAVLHVRHGDPGPANAGRRTVDGPVELRELGMALVDPFGFSLGLEKIRSRDRFPSLQWHRGAVKTVWSGREYAGVRRGFLGWIDPQTNRTGWSVLFDRGGHPLPRRGLLVLVFACFTVPLAFLVLRDSRRLARVRAGLLIRLGILSACIPVAVWLVLVGMAGARELLGGDLSDLRTGIASRIELLLPLFGLALLAFWWGEACRRLLRIEAWPLVLFSIIAVGLLAAVALSLGIRPVDPPIL